MILLTAAQFGLIVAVVVYLTVNLVHLVRVRPAAERLPEPPFVSVCVPARNEERDIKACLESLLNQDYPHFEVIAVDDQSTDSTLAVMRSVAERHSNLVVLEGEPLPPGWLGKPYALHQAYQKARGEYLLFTDADPVFQPHALRSAMGHLFRNKLDVLTLMPGARFGSFWERAVQPVIFGFIAALTRFKKVNDPDNPKAMGIGAFILIRREVYEKIEGYAGVKQEVLDDVSLAHRAKEGGFAFQIADGKALFSIRMYYSIREIWIGWRKNLFVAMKKSVPRTLYHVGVVLGFCLTPYLLVIYHLAEGESLFGTLVSLAGLVLVWITGATLCDELGLERRNAFLFPLGALVMSGIMFNSMAQVLIKGQTEWRGRTYSS